MDFSDSPDEGRFRAEARTWLEANAADFLLPEQPVSDDEFAARARAWLALKAKSGFAGILWPKEIGGRGGTPIENVIFMEEESRFRLPIGTIVNVGFNQAVPTIRTWGTPQQAERFTRPTLMGEITWVQLFSEPSAGSDLAAVRTRAVRADGGWLINGQKVWSSWAKQADWGLLIVRTDPEAPKHAGLTYFLVDMRTPGIEVRAIEQISGRSDFNEVFFTHVFIPDDGLLGAVDNGWRVALTTLMTERLGTSGGLDKGDGVLGLVGQALAVDPTLASTAWRSKLARWWVEEQGLRNFRYRVLTQLSKGQEIGPEAGLVKLVYARKLQQTACFAMDLHGYSGLFAENDAALAAVQEDYMWAAAMRIAGGTDEILRNTLAERVLDLPGEPRADKNIPFSQLVSS